MRFKVTPALRGYAKSTLIPHTNGAHTLWEKGNRMMDYNVDVTNRIRDNKVFFGNFDDLTSGLWGGLELVVDPFSKVTTDQIVLTVFQHLNWVFRCPDSFVIGIPASDS